MYRIFLCAGTREEFSFFFLKLEKTAVYLIFWRVRAVGDFWLKCWGFAPYAILFHACEWLHFPEKRGNGVVSYLFGAGDWISFPIFRENRALSYPLWPRDKHSAKAARKLSKRGRERTLFSGNGKGSRRAGAHPQDFCCFGAKKRRGEVRPPLARGGGTKYVGEGFALPQANLLHTEKSTEGARTVSTTEAVEKSLLREGEALPYKELVNFLPW